MARHAAGPCRVPCRVTRLGAVLAGDLSPCGGSFLGRPPTRPVELRPVLTAPVSAVPALFATVRARSSPFRPVKTASSSWSAGSGFDRTRRARTVAKKAGTALTGAVGTGRYLGDKLVAVGPL